MKAILVLFDSLPDLLSRQGAYTHLITDHQHYFEDGGATYHTRYDSYEFVRGQEGDPWKAHVDPPGYDGPRLDWPPYAKATESAAQIQHLRHDAPAEPFERLGLDATQGNP